MALNGEPPRWRQHEFDRDLKKLGSAHNEPMTEAQGKTQAPKPNGRPTPASFDSRAAFAAFVLLYGSAYPNFQQFEPAIHDLLEWPLVSEHAGPCR